MVEIHFVQAVDGNIFWKILKYVDAIEVWNGTNPHDSLSNEDAFYQWTKAFRTRV